MKLQNVFKNDRRKLLTAEIEVMFGTISSFSGFVRCGNLIKSL